MITNEQKEELLQLYYDRGILKKEIRSYEVSLWTLLDEFITVLKWSDVEQKGRIEEGKMTLNIDGTLKLSFSIPMYYREHGVLVENPSWYNTQNGNLIQGLRKVKVIFNKGEYTAAEASKHVFEFVVTKVEESHDQDILTCNVEAEGLAFLELGKLGYKISLSLDNFELVYKEWEENDGDIANQPIQNLDYWCSEMGLVKFGSEPVNSRTWYYDVQMNWNSFADAPNRVTDKVYEEPYTTSWTNNLAPNASESYREKARSVEEEHSNLYNLTQEVAEKFGIFCRYEYLYDDNYHITGKKVVFYNNFLGEDPKDVVSFKYPYSSSKVTRTLESTLVTTKLFILDTDDNSVGGYCSIMNSPSNYSHEDYILNFDYMYQSGAISKEQYDYIIPYNLKMREINEQLSTWQLQRDTYELLKPEIEAKLAVAEKSVDLDQEQELQNKKLRNALDSKDGVSDGFIQLTGANADYLLIARNDKGEYYINLAYTNKGILKESVRIYKTLSSGTLSGEVTSFSFNYDDYNNITSITLTNVSLIIDNGTVATKAYLTYKYDPCLYYDNIIKMWQSRYYDDLAKKEEYELELADIEVKLESLYDVIELKIAEKNAAIKVFERMMGPALREGYWQPEDYNDYGEHHVETKSISNGDITLDSGDSVIVAWDPLSFDDEETLYYEIGLEQTIEYYPCIDLNAVFPSGIPTDLSDYSVVWRATSYTEDYNWNSIKDLTIFAVGSLALIRFIKQGNTVKPVLMLVGAKTMSTDELTRMKSSGGQARLEKYNVSIDNNGNVSISHTNITSIGNNWIQVATGTAKTTVPIVYPRIKFSSLLLKTETENLFVKYDNNLLELGFDYYIHTRNTQRSSDLNYYPEYYVTIKPETIIKYGTNRLVTVDYILSNASTAIYLDALQVSKENAFPKASYEIDTNILTTDLTHLLYTTLARIVHVNDTQLKLYNAFGYISQAELDLDHYENDKVEIKNYKTKFEDLFSNIVAQTESMKQMGSGIAAAINGNIPLAEAALTATIDQWQDTLDNYLGDYFTTSTTIQDHLAQLFDEAGSILGNANKAMKQGYALSLQNAAILSGFAEKVTNELSVEVIKSTDKPDSFKVGDIWIQTDAQGNEIARYIATASSDNLTTDRTGTGGFVRTYDGTLAQITGTALDVNADDGTINVKAINNINIGAGHTVNIGANEDVNITGNKEVNIGGTTINIGSLENNGSNVGGVNIIAAKYDTNNFASVKQSRVLIHPEEIEMAGSKITLLTGADANGANAVSIDGSSGIWIGSSKKITLTTTANLNSANVEISPAHIFFGMNNLSNGNAAAVEMTENLIILGAGNGMTALDTNGINVAGSTSGVQITKNKIGLAVGNSTDRSVIVMDSSGIVVGTGTNPKGNDLTSGSYVSIAGSGIIIGSKGSLDINTTNFVLDSDAAITANSNEPMLRLGTAGAPALEYKNGALSVTGAITANSLSIGSNGSYMKYDTTNGLNIGNGGLTYNGSTLTVTGNINATNLTISGTAATEWLNAAIANIGGWTIDTTRIYSRYNNLDSNYVGLDSGTSGENYAIWAGDDTSTSAPFRVKRNGSVYLNSLMVLDQRSRTSIEAAWGAWEIDNNAIHEDIITSNDNLTQTGYVAIDFSSLNFKLAVSVRGAWSGNTLTVTATLWGKISKTITESASFYITSVEAEGILGAETQLVRINYKETYGSNSNTYSTSYPITCHGIWLNGYDTGYLDGTPNGSGTFASWLGSSTLTASYTNGKNESKTIVITNISSLPVSVSWNAASFLANGVYASVTINGTIYTHFYAE